MASAAAIRNVQQAYIAYYGRGADPAGLDFWATRLDTQGAGQLQNIIDAFATSQEFTVEYGNPSNENEWTTYINKIYQNVLNRDADQAGLNFYLEGLKSGQFTIKNLPLDILNGAINTDIATVNNKTQAALAFTPQIDQPDEILNYNPNSVQIARDWMSSIGPDQQSLDAALAQKPAIINAIVIAGNPGETFTLTVNEDNLTGTARNDKFVAEVVNVPGAGGGTLTNTLQSVDKLNGGTGTDTLTATLFGGDPAPSLNSIEIIQVRSTAAGSTLDLGASAGVTTLIASNGTADVVFNNVGSVANFALANQINGPLLNSDATFNGSTAETINVGADSWGTADNPGVVVFPGAAATTLKMNIADVRAAVLGLSKVETLAITSSGVDKLWLIGPDSTAETVTVTGGGTLDLLGGGPGPATPFLAVKTFDASGNNGGVKATIASSQTEVTVTGGSGGDTLSVGSAGTVAVDTGKGNDTLTVTTAADKITAALGDGDDKLTVSTKIDTAGSSYDGGDGTDTFVSDKAQLDALSKALSAKDPTVTFTNFEVLGVTDPLDVALDLTKFGVGSVELVQGSNGGSVTGLNDAATVSVGGATTGLTLTQASDTDANSLTLNIGTAATAGISVTGVVADTVETLSVTSNGTGAGKNTLSLASTDLTSLTITGKEALVLSTTSAKLTTLDGSGMEGALETGDVIPPSPGKSNVTFANGTGAADLKAITVSGGTGNDVLYGSDGTTFQTFTISGGEGKDQIQGGGFTDTLTGGAEDDRLFGLAGNDTLDGGAGDDQVWGGAGADNLTGGDGKDIFGYAAAGQSAGVNVDTITDFVSGTDRIGLKDDVTFPIAGGKITFLGNVANTNDALTALDIASKNGIASANAVFDQATKQVLIATADQATPDMSINLTGVSTMQQADFVVL